MPVKHWQRAIDLLDIMESVDNFNDLEKGGFPPSLRLHKLKGARSDQWAIDIHKTDGWRITFIFDANEFCHVSVENYDK